ncbi:TPA: hypothetical protein ACHSON_004670, partial [Raoultella planticola ATCC 33531]
EADEDESLRGQRFGYAGGPERSFVPQQFLAGLTPPWCIGLSPPADSKNRPRPGHRKMKSFASMALGCGPGATMSECDSQPKSQKKHESLFHVAC